MRKLIVPLSLLAALVAPAPSGAAHAVSDPSSPDVDADVLVATIVRLVTGAPAPEVPRPREGGPALPDVPVSGEGIGRAVDDSRDAVDANAADALARAGDAVALVPDAREDASHAAGQVVE